MASTIHLPERIECFLRSQVKTNMSNTSTMDSTFYYSGYPAKLLARNPKAEFPPFPPPAIDNLADIKRIATVDAPHPIIQV